jgi:hypothetical protein
MERFDETIAAAKDGNKDGKGKIIGMIWLK